MSKGKPFYFRLEPGQLLAALIQIPDTERGAWITQVAIELATGAPSSPFSEALFREAERFQAEASERSRQAGLASAEKRKQALTPVNGRSTDVQRKPTQSSSSSSTEAEEKKNKYADHVSMLGSEYEKLVLEHGEDKTGWMIQKLNVYKGSKGKKYKNDYLAILSWVVDKAAKEFKEAQPDPFELYPEQRDLVL